MLVCSADSTGHATVLEVLLEFGANRNDVDRRGKSALHVAVLQNHARCVQLLADQQGSTLCDCAECSALRKKRETFFWLSCHQVEMDFEEEYIKTKGHFERAGDPDAAYIHPGMPNVSVFVKSDERRETASRPADLEYPCGYWSGMTPLMLATSAGCVGGMLSLLYYGADARAAIRHHLCRQ